MKKTVILCLTLLLVMSFSTPALAWHGLIGGDSTTYVDVHFSDTRAWCIEQGMSADNANVVANYDSATDLKYMDDATWHLNRVNYVTADKTRDCDTRLYWFDEKMNNAKIYLDRVSALNVKYKQTKIRSLQSQIKDNKNLALQELGFALHPLQDRWAHLDAGQNKSDAEVSRTHGMLNVLTKVRLPNGTYKWMCLETARPGGTQYRPTDNLYDDINYDCVNGQWTLLNDGRYTVDQTKVRNSRWIGTKNESVWAIQQFLTYANQRGINFK